MRLLEGGALNCFEELVLFSKLAIKCYSSVIGLCQGVKTKFEVNESVQIGRQICFEELP